MSTEQNHEDETVADLAPPAVTNEEALTIKGGATDPKPGSPPSPLPGSLTPTRPTPRLIEPCV